MGGKKGRSIACPLGRSAKRRPQPTPQGSSQIIADLDASEVRWLEQQSQRLTNQPPPQHEAMQAPPPDLFDPEGENDYISDINPEEAYLINHNILDDSNEEPPEVNNFSEYVKGSNYKKKQIKEAQNWAKVFGPMFLDFMVGSKRTTQWGLDTWSVDYNKSCSCGTGKNRLRKVDLVDLTMRLIRMGFIGGSPIHPESAFSIRLLRLHHSLWKYCSVQTQGFSLGFDEFLDPANPLLLVAGTTSKVATAFLPGYRRLQTDASI
ncbi:uncharacterized protein MELLADRAFT_93876 [Melampsora larici-populina 98AG31]|uniref:CxC1-like cysteine cluster associated with KDZ transposases domain-containing protein n=1 Tax=Melampsora larici-populina (strain 98AG31 / pathotype 3-4-7) TaxID=747676 RepID=F4S5K9_MELLP|nr:uncharacterized protein MELLADRAFT_93876 [Melampsora larici-populina 98AG31]EGG00045.1 hypothetical protein MELLADRAFT_93876 [Melampsora larici-populina 98AG31]